MRGSSSVIKMRGGLRGPVIAHASKACRILEAYHNATRPNTVPHTPVNLLGTLCSGETQATPGRSSYRLDGIFHRRQRRHETGHHGGAVLASTIQRIGIRGSRADRQGRLG